MKGTCFLFQVLADDPRNVVTGTTVPIKAHRVRGVIMKIDNCLLPLKKSYRADHRINRPLGKLPQLRRPFGAAAATLDRTIRFLQPATGSNSLDCRLAAGKVRDLLLVTSALAKGTCNPAARFRQVLGRGNAPRVVLVQLQALGSSRDGGCRMLVHRMNKDALRGHRRCLGNHLAKEIIGLVMDFHPVQGAEHHALPAVVQQQAACQQRVLDRRQRGNEPQPHGPTQRGGDIHRESRHLERGGISRDGR